MKGNVKGITSNFDNPLAIYFANSGVEKQRKAQAQKKIDEKKMAYVELTTANVNTAASVDSENSEVNTAASSEHDTAIDIISSIAPVTIKSANESIILPAEIVPEMSLLDDYTNYIKGIQNRMKKDFMKICVALNEIKTKELYKSRDYEDIFSYAAQELGYSRDTVNKYTAVAELFIMKTVDGYKSVFVDAGEKDFTVGALIELLPLRKNSEGAITVATEMIENGEISPDMSSADIRKVVKAKRGKTSKTREKKNSNYSTSEIAENVEVNENEIAQKIERQNEIAKINSSFKTAYDAVKTLTGDNDDMIVMLQAQREMSKIASSIDNQSAAGVDSEESEIEKLKNQLAEMQAENARLREENSAYDKTAQAQAKTIENLMAENHGLQITVETLKKGVDNNEKQIEELKSENDRLKENVEFEEKIGEEKVISKGGKILSIVNEKFGIIFKYTKKGSHVWYQNGKQITRDKVYQVMTSVKG